MTPIEPVFIRFWADLIFLEAHRSIRVWADSEPPRFFLFVSCMPRMGAKGGRAMTCTTQHLLGSSGPEKLPLPSLQWWEGTPQKHFCFLEGAAWRLSWLPPRPPLNAFACTVMPKIRKQPNRGIIPARGEGWGTLHIPSGTKLLLTKSCSEIIIFEKLRISYVIPWKKVLLSRRFWRCEPPQKLRKITLQNYFRNNVVPEGTNSFEIQDLVLDLQKIACTGCTQNRDFAHHGFGKALRPFLVLDTMPGLLRMFCLNQKRKNLGHSIQKVF